MAGAWAIVQWVMDPGPPVVVQSAEVRTPQVLRGQRVEIMFTVDRLRVCPSLIVGFMIEPDNHDHAALRLDPVWGGYSDVGRGIKTLVTRPTPNQPGRYCYRSNATHWCGAHTYITQQPDACFEVVG